MPSTSITGRGAYLPSARPRNADLETPFDTSDGWITTRTGIRERGVSLLSHWETAYRVARHALERLRHTDAGWQLRPRSRKVGDGRWC